jgi:hypothetical protein
MVSLSTAVVALEQAVAETVVKTVDKPAVANVIFDLGKLGRAGLGKVDEVRGALVHVLALPSHRDIRQLDARMAWLGVAVAELEAQLEDMRAERERSHE